MVPFDCHSWAAAHATADPSPGCQLGFDWIVHHIRDCLSVIRLVANQVIVIFRLPKHSGATQHFISSFGGKRFPPLDKIWQSMVPVRFDEHVDMIWHHAPRMKLISPSGKMVQILAHHVGNLWIFQPTPTTAGIQVGFNALRMEMRQSLAFLVGQAIRMFECFR